eukprot:6847323-Prymnesium_polylepis.1
MNPHPVSPRRAPPRSTRSAEAAERTGCRSPVPSDDEPIISRGLHGAERSAASGERKGWRHAVTQGPTQRHATKGNASQNKRQR